MELLKELPRKHLVDFPMKFSFNKFQWNRHGILEGKPDGILEETPLVNPILTHQDILVRIPEGIPEGIPAGILGANSG